MKYTSKGNTMLSIMKTVTIKADAEFDHYSAAWPDV